MSPVRVNRCATRKAEAQLQVHAAVPKASSSGQCVARSRVCATQIIVEHLHVCAQSSACASAYFANIDSTLKGAGELKQSLACKLQPL